MQHPTYANRNPYRHQGIGKQISLQLVGDASLRRPLRPVRCAGKQIGMHWDTDLLAGIWRDLQRLAEEPLSDLLSINQEAQLSGTKGQGRRVGIAHQQTHQKGLRK